QRARIASSRKWRNVRIMRPGSPECAAFGFFRTQTPSKGVKRTATIQDMINAMATTAKIEKVYSPAALRAKPIGTNPATVTNVPVSIGKATEVQAKLAACSLSSPCSSRMTIISTADHRVIDQQPERDDQRPQRYPLKVDPEKLHSDEHRREDQRDRE